MKSKAQMKKFDKKEKVLTLGILAFIWHLDFDI